MFGFLRRLFGKKKTQRFDLYAEEETLLYCYWNGNRYIFQDPMVLYKRAMEVGPELSVNIQVARTPIKGNIEASNALLAQIRKIFDIPPYDPDKPGESGLTEVALTKLLAHFLTYCDIIKKNILEPLTPQPTSEVTALPTTSATAADQITSPTSATISTEESPSSAMPTVPPSVSESPSDSSNPPLIILGPTQMERETPS